MLVTLAQYTPDSVVIYTYSLHEVLAVFACKPTLTQIHPVSKFSGKRAQVHF